MALPIQSYPTYKLILPSNKQELLYRSFSVKEEKILLMALEGKDIAELGDALKQIVNNCTFGKIDVSELTTFDLEYIFLQLRVKSIGDFAKMSFSFLKCPKNEFQPCKKTIEVDVDLSKIEVEFPEKSENVIAINDTLKIALRYPGFDALVKVDLLADDNSIDTLLDVISSCIVSIYDDENEWDLKVETKESIREFLESLSLSTFEKITEYIKNIPTISKKIEIKCPLCELQDSVTVKGLKSFFSLV